MSGIRLVAGVPRWYPESPDSERPSGLGAQRPGPPVAAFLSLPGGARERRRVMNPKRPVAEPKKLFNLNLARGYRKPEPLVLVNGLAEQSYSWFANRVAWTRQFDVKVPEVLVY